MVRCYNDFINKATLIYFAFKLIAIRFIIISKSFILSFLIKHREGEVIILSSIMESNLSCYQLKIDYYSCKFCVSLMVHPKQKLIVNTQKKKREEYEHTSQESHQITKKAREDRSREAL